MSIAPANDTPRWKQRLENFNKALGRLEEGIEESKKQTLSDLSKEGIIQRFEYTWELAWKTLMDFLDSEGVNLETRTPNNVIKSAIAANILQSPSTWLEMVQSRNILSHTYDKEALDEIFPQVQDAYFYCLRDLSDFLNAKK